MTVVLQWALGHDRITTEPDHVAFPGIEVVRAASSRNLVLGAVPKPACVQDCLHVKVVWWCDFLKLQSIEDPLESRLRHWPLCRPWS